MSKNISLNNKRQIGDLTPKDKSFQMTFQVVQIISKTKQQIKCRIVDQSGIANAKFNKHIDKIKIESTYRMKNLTVVINNQHIQVQMTPQTVIERIPNVIQFKDKVNDISKKIFVVKQDLQYLKKNQNNNKKNQKQNNSDNKIYNNNISKQQQVKINQKRGLIVDGNKIDYENMRNRSNNNKNKSNSNKHKQYDNDLYVGSYDTKMKYKPKYQQQNKNINRYKQRSNSKTKYVQKINNNLNHLNKSLNHQNNNSNNNSKSIKISIRSAQQILIDRGYYYKQIKNMTIKQLVKNLNNTNQKKNNYYYHSYNQIYKSTKYQIKYQNNQQHFKKQSLNNNSNTQTSTINNNNQGCISIKQTLKIIDHYVNVCVWVVTKKKIVLQNGNWRVMVADQSGSLWTQFNQSTVLQGNQQYQLDNMKIQKIKDGQILLKQTQMSQFRVNIKNKNRSYNLNPAN